MLSPLLPLALLAVVAGPPAGDRILPLREVHPDLKVTAWTVFQGTRIEPFEGHVVGVARGLLGPGRDIVLVEFEDARLKHTGIVHGMSGSPVYAGDRLIGALSLALSPFPKDAIGGVTPIEYMLAETDDHAGGPAAEPRAVPAQRGTRPMAPPTAPLQPSGLPVTLIGVRPDVLDHYRDAFAAAGLAPIRAAAGSDPGLPLGADALQPGAPVAAVLADGDLPIVASGTVTYREGNRILAFGHPFLMRGKVDFPMAPAEVVATLADQTYSYKVTNTGPAVGRVIFDRVTAIVGEIGSVPDMLPLSVRLVGGGRPIADFHYRLARDPLLTPLILQVLVANSLALTWDYRDDATYHLRGEIRLAGNLRLPLHETYAVLAHPRTSSTAAMATDVGLTFQQIHLNSFAEARTEAVDLTYDLDGPGRLVELVSVFLEPEKVRAGELVSIRVQLHERRGDSRAAIVQVPIPSWATGTRLAIRVADAGVLRAEQLAAGPPGERVADLTQLVELLSDRPRADRFYVQLLGFSPDAVLQHKRLPSLPSSVAEVLAYGGGPFRRLPRSLLWQGTIETQGVAAGAREIQVEVLP